ncbi:MAG: hypothetical protein Q9216_005011 [Gyalolechia sp. 2 TL-2023]
MERTRPSYYLLENKAYSDDGTSNARCGSNAGKKTNNARSRWPHALNVVTNFSKPQQIAQRAADTRRRPEEVVVEGFQKRHRRLNSSADVKTPDSLKKTKSERGKTHNDTSGSNYDAALGLSSHEFENTRKAPSPPRDNKGPINNLKRASSKMTTLSPSDRPIVIGISVPSDKLDQHTISPDAGPTPSHANRLYSRGRRPSDAPTVIVTPANAGSPWSVGPEDQPNQRRAPSSLYSRATNARGTPRQDNVPPMPVATRISQSLSEHPKGRNERATSAYTIFDDDDSPKEVSRDRRDSGEPQPWILKRSSTDSIATRHRSQGWWNHLMSPFFPKPGTVPWRSTSRMNELVPDLPETAPVTRLVKDDDPPDRHSAPRTRRSSSGHTTIWTDLSQDDAEKKPEDITMLHSPFHDSPRGLENPEKDLSDWFNSLGAAAEYYHACWHDQKYCKPYFECQNHVCIPRRLGNFPLPEDGPEESESLQGGAEDSRKTAAPMKPKDDESNDFQQTPANRFSAAFKEAMTPKAKGKERPLSETPTMDDVDGTPVVHEAQAAPVVRAPGPVPAALPSPPSSEAEIGVAKTTPAPPIAPRNDSKEPPPTAISTALTHSSPAAAPSQDVESSRSTEPAERDAPASLPPQADKPAKRFVAVMPPNHPSVTRATPVSPEIVSPAAQMHRGPNDYALSKLPQDKEPPASTTSNAVPTTIINHYHYLPSHEVKNDQVSLRDTEPPPRPTWSSRQIKEAREQEKEQVEQSSRSSRRCTPKLTACLDRGKPKTKKQKWLLIGITSGLMIMIIIILLLAMLLTRKGDSMEVQSQWLNLTGFPPIPTGISTVIQPNPVQENSGCIHPATLWSCAVPKEQQASTAPNAPNQPNFRLEIRFQNGSIAEGGASNDTKLDRRLQPSSGNAVTAGSFIKSRLLHVRDFTSGLFNPSPAPPTREDQIFLGNTTDKNQQPFDGTVTPFFISFVPSTKLPSSKMTKRAFEAETNITANGTNPFPDLDATIPPPASNADGTASPALLYPLVSAQPLRLYNRDTDTEHYGFYTYFDRSIFLKSAALLNFTGASPSEIPDDENGGAEQNAARVRCTWAQTRFLVQIWTRKESAAPLLQSSNSSSNSPPGSRPKNLTESSANDFTRPGSFPYPVSITLDRHGGDIKKKMVYCYDLDQEKHIIGDEKQIQLEDRAFAGALVNPAQGPFGKVNVTGDDGGPGGIDGGSGGCGCTWENFSGGRTVMSEPEILVHASAPSRGSDDARYRKEAVAILEFEAVRRHDLPPPKVQIDSEERQALGQDSITSTDPAPRNHLSEALTSWMTPILTRPSTQLLVGRTPAPSFYEKTSTLPGNLQIKRTPADQYRPRTAPSGPVAIEETPRLGHSLSHSFETPPSVIPDSQPVQDRSKRPFEENSSPSPTHRQSPSSKRAKPDRGDEWGEWTQPEDTSTPPLNEPPRPSSPSPNHQRSPSPKRAQPDGGGDSEIWTQPEDTSTPPLNNLPQVSSSSSSSNPSSPNIPPQPPTAHPPASTIHEDQHPRYRYGYRRRQALPPRPKPGNQPFSSTSSSTTQVTPNLKILRKVTTRILQSVKPHRTIHPLERGHWRFTIPADDDENAWTRKAKEDMWETLTNVIQSGSGGWGVWAVFEERRLRDGDDGFGGEEGEEDGNAWRDFGEMDDSSEGSVGVGGGGGGTVKVYCWGEIVPEIYAVLFTATGRRIKGCGARWIDAGGCAVVDMGAA